MFKAEISGALRYIKAYEGPSRIWFVYQDSLIEGRNRLSAIFSHFGWEKPLVNYEKNKQPPQMERDREVESLSLPWEGSVRPFN